MPGARRWSAEIWIVLGLSLGASGVYSLVSLIRKATLPGGLRDQTASLNASLDSQQVFDLVYQLLGIGFALVPVALALYLLSLDDVQDTVARRLGLDRGHARFDVLWGLALAAVIGIPGLGLYAAGRALGLTVDISLAPDNPYWWTTITLILAAIQNAVLEEVIVVGFLMTRLRQLSWSTPAIIITSAAVRGSYHLYQGVGPGFGNFVMGLVFGYWYHRTRRVLPLVVAHTVLDVVAFVGYSVLGARLGLR